ncbi:MAG TPA: tetratricopeptide repeat protein [Thermoanaerobaculia bacterium]|nr:tetratricopeptide repeat protein [Thermoanaerobaculia bacterium]
MIDRLSPRARQLEASAAKERSEAPALVAQLLEQPAERWTLMVRNNSRFHTWGLFDLLLTKSREQSFRNADLGEAFARLGLEIADPLEPRYGKERAGDLRARAWAAIGNAHRLRSDLKSAEEAFRTAAAHLEQGTGEATEQAAFFDLQASLLRAQRRLDEALKLLRRACSIFLRFGERHRAGRTLVKMSTVHRYSGSPERAIPLLYKALDLIDPAREPRLMLIAWHNLTDDLAEAGQFMEAQKLLVKARPLYQQFPEAWASHPRKWVEGRIARGLGQHDRAETLLLEAREGFLAEGPGSAYDIALVSLELALVYAEQHRLRELKRLAQEMVLIFSSRGIHREALAALTFWKQAVESEQEQDGLELMVRIASFLKRSQYDNTLVFEPD